MTKGSFRSTQFQWHLRLLLTKVKCGTKTCKPHGALRPQVILVTHQLLLQAKCLHVNVQVTIHPFLPAVNHHRRALPPRQFVQWRNSNCVGPICLPFRYPKGKWLSMGNRDWVSCLHINFPEFLSFLSHGWPGPSLRTGNFRFRAPYFIWTNSSEVFLFYTSVLHSLFCITVYWPSNYSIYQGW